VHRSLRGHYDQRLVSRSISLETWRHLHRGGLGSTQGSLKRPLCGGGTMAPCGSTRSSCSKRPDLTRRDVLALAALGLAAAAPGVALPGAPSGHCTLSLLGSLVL